jgi:hypothetical protein
MAPVVSVPVRVEGSEPHIIGLKKIYCLARHLTAHGYFMGEESLAREDADSLKS